MIWIANIIMIWSALVFVVLISSLVVGIFSKMFPRTLPIGYRLLDLLELITFNKISHE